MKNVVESCALSPSRSGNSRRFLISWSDPKSPGHTEREKSDSPDCWQKSSATERGVKDRNRSKRRPKPSLTASAPRAEPGGRGESNAQSHSVDNFKGTPMASQEKPCAGSFASALSTSNICAAALMSKMRRLPPAVRKHDCEQAVRDECIRYEDSQRGNLLKRARNERNTGQSES